MEPATPPKIETELLSRLTSRLGYSAEAGYVDLSGPELPQATTGSMRELRRARDGMGVVGAFCLRVHPLGGSASRRRLRPIVFLASATDNDAAQQAHRRVWSQGIAPFLLVATPSGVFICNGLSYASKDWEKNTPWVPEVDIDLSSDLRPYEARRLRASISWQDFAKAPDGGVDASLLKSLKELSSIFRNGRYGNETLPPLAPPLANALMGRLLYVYFLWDRGILTQERLNRWGYDDIDLQQWDRAWPIDRMWDFFDALDVPFNGSIFQIAQHDRDKVRQVHVKVVREVMRHDFSQTAGGVQLSFVDIYFPALRTETMSAVYEQFLHEEDPRRREDEGAFYTRPFLADYVLDRVEDMLTAAEGKSGLADGVRILDGAAGSGVFLVGAYRRMIENALQEQQVNRLPLAELQKILCNNIFAVELRDAACHVAAFSLYLTLLDYVSEEELELIVQGHHEKKLFPPLVGHNILTRDLFSKEPLPSGFPSHFECIVGNPPWSSLKKLSNLAQSCGQNHPEWPVDGGRGAELFVWKCAKEHLREEGVMGMVLPLKSFLSPSASTFAPRFSAELQIEGITNLGHFRRVLFADAEEAAVAMFAKNRAPDPRGSIWVHAPTLANQPRAADGRLLDILVDRADVNVFRYASIRPTHRTSRAWFEILMLRPIDRKAIEYFDVRCASGLAATFSQLEQSLGLQLRRGCSANETGLPEEYLYRSGSLPRKLTEQQWKKLKPEHQSLFGGHVLLLTRTGQVEGYFEHRLAFVSTFLGLVFNRKGDGESSRASQRRFLMALERYIKSDFFKYMLAIYGRKWLVDGRRFDPKDLGTVPVPFVSLDDPGIDKIEGKAQGDLTEELCNLFSLPPDVRRAVTEYPATREDFKNAQVPPNAFEEPGAGAISQYKAALTERLAAFVGARGSFVIGTERTQTPQQLCVLDVQYVPAGQRVKKEAHDVARTTALRRYDVEGASFYTDTLFISSETNAPRVLVVKPLYKYLWTSERAFSDGAAILNEVLRSGATAGEGRGR